MKSISPIATRIDATPPALRAYTKLVAFSTLFLIFAGAMVTSTGSGLAVPDWPLSYGKLMPRMVGGIFYEHGHRMIAATVGFLTIIQAVWLQLREPKRWLRKLGWMSLGAVIAQGLLGGLTVIFLLPPAISIGHAALAEIFFCINVSIAFFASRSFQRLHTIEKGDAPVEATTFFAVLVFVQIVLGAVMRHFGAGLAIPDFPLSFGRIVPEFATARIAINYAHRVGAAAVLIAMIAMTLRFRRFDLRHPLRQAGNFLLVLVPLQVMLGAYTVWSGKHPITTSIHVATGALTLGLALIIALTARTVAWRSEHRAALIEVPA